MKCVNGGCNLVCISPTECKCTKCGTVVKTTTKKGK